MSQDGLTHTASRPMHARLESGAARDGDVIDVLASYDGPDGAAHGWRGTLEPKGDALTVRHYNVVAGEESLSVQFDYSRR